MSAGRPEPFQPFQPFDTEALTRWLVEAGVGRAADGPVALTRIGDGLSNLTFSASIGDRSVVVRRPPPPPRPRGANDMRREATILRALADTAVPVPRVVAVAEDGEVAEAHCYAMEHLDGLVATAELPPAIDTHDDRRACAEAFVDVLASLHRVDWRGVGLGDLGRPDGFLERQLSKLPRLIADDGGALPPEFALVRDDLAADLPPSGPAALLHGDYRFGNVMVGAERPARIVGVLDWELAAIGDPLADLAYTLVTYAVPDEPLHALTEMSTVTLLDGFPSRVELAERYRRATGADLAHLAWHEAFQLFKLAILFEYNRRKTDTAEGDPYYADPNLVAGLLTAARAVLDERRPGRDPAAPTDGTSDHIDVRRP